ncbi:hypothetical protein PS3A_38550 [Pseudomonas sp. 3A(2025)]
MGVLDLVFGKPGERMSEEDREIFKSIRKLKTLKVFNGRLSISPSEVITEAFIKERIEAARLITRNK